MSDDPSFRELYGRVKRGDAQAAAELVRRYEPTIRLVVRRRLASPALRRVLDSMDVCQSVLASFFVRAAAGQYPLETPQQLLKLLTVMARNKVINQVKKLQTARRNQQHVQAISPAQLERIAPGPGPCQILAEQELQQEFHRRLSAEERQLADLRTRGRSWEEIAAEVGGSPDAVRMRLKRAADRVLRELDADD